MRENITKISQIKRLIHMRQSFGNLTGQAAPSQGLKQWPKTGIKIRLGIRTGKAHTVILGKFHIVDIHDGAPALTETVPFEPTFATR